MEESVVLKIGGSLLYDLNLNLNKEFVTKYVNWVSAAVNRYKHIVIIIGGGTVSRHLVKQTAGFAISEKNAHNIGMITTQVNAELLRAVSNIEEAFVPQTFGQLLEALIGDKRKLVISGGHKSGWSSDMNAAILASVIGCKKVYKLSNVDHVYTADPASDPMARILKDLTWSDYFKQFGITEDIAKHDPGMHVPVGAHAAQFASKKGISFFLSGGKTLDDESDLEKVFESGTYIHP